MADALAFEDSVTENKDAFLQKVRDISSDLLINPNWLMTVMHKESGINSKAYNPNPNSGATGLIQFMPATAQGLGTTTDALKNMSNVQQLDYVKKYFAPYKGKINSYFDLYMVTFFPLGVGKPDDWVVQGGGLSADTIARANPAISQGKSAVTVADFKTYLMRDIPSQFKSLIEAGANDFLNAGKQTELFARKHYIAIPIVAVALAGIIFAAYKLLGSNTKMAVVAAPTPAPPILIS